MSLRPKTYSFIIPKTWKYILFATLNSDKVIYIYSDVYYFFISLPKTYYKFWLDTNIDTFSISTIYSDVYMTTYWTNLRKIFNSFNKPFFLKIKFKGKGYYIFKNFKQTITPQFGHSHRLYVYSYYVSVKFLSKTHIFLFGLNYRDIILNGRSIKLMRPINIFTGRGVRFSRQIIYRKLGKVSSYR